MLPTLLAIPQHRARQSPSKHNMSEDAVDLQTLLDSDFFNIIEAWDEDPPAPLPPKKKRKKMESHPGDSSDSSITAAKWTEATMLTWSSEKMDRYLEALRQKHDGVIPEDRRPVLQRVKRKLRNRETARLSRKRKAAELKNYKERIRCLNYEVEWLRAALRRKICSRCNARSNLSCNEIFVL